MRHIFIVNPAAGRGTSDTVLLPALQTYLRDSALDYEIHRTLNKEEVGAYVRQRAAEGGEIRFYACGGDGTACDVVNGMADFPNAQLAVYPCGTGNDFVRNFTNKEYFRDIDRLVKAGAVSCDLIRYNGRYAVNMLNIGVDCDVAARGARMKGPLAGGGLSYAAAALSILPHYSTYRISYELEDGMHSDELMLAAVANGHFCGGGFHSSPKASLSDGLLDVIIVRPVHGLKMIRMLLQYRNGKHLEHEQNLAYLHYFKCRSLRLEPIDPVRVAVDGEIEEMQPGLIECVPNAIRLAVPEGCAPIEN